ncbi:MAG: acetyl-CoA carboxylase carboxyltransferase subunit alpha [Agathobacter sp.]
MFLEIDEIVSEKLMNNIPLSAMDKVNLARDVRRPKIQDYIENLFTDFFEQKGDMLGKEDGSIYGGIALFHGTPVTVLGHRKGNDLKENIACNFGMPGPEGYRKALRMMEQAERFGRPIITFIDTPGAYPGIEAEQYGQSQAIANNLARMSSLAVPIISIVTGEGSSGGALAIGVANRVFMLENAIYSILSPEGFSTILWNDASKKEEASEVMKLTAQDLKKLGVIDGIIEEPKGGAHKNPKQLYKNLDRMLMRELSAMENKSGGELERARYKKFRYMDEQFLTLGGNR